MVGKFLSNLVMISFSMIASATMGVAEDAPLAIAADFEGPTDRYPHNIMGSLRAHTDLAVTLALCNSCMDWPSALAIRLPVDLVFEDFAPRLVDLDRDGVNEIVVVESDQQKGSRLTVWEVLLVDGRPTLVRGATTDFIGTRFRWLAPIGAEDFDGDGRVEIAYVEKPHLDKILRIVRREGSQLRLVASLAGVTNHAIGQEKVQSRIETCNGHPTIIALDATGIRRLAIRFDGTTVGASELGETSTPHILDPAPACGR
ncbi:MAG: FG-GAP repeat domain-containing protein [Thermomicrobiales bacterium]